jgi:hypothetical protein
MNQRHYRTRRNRFGMYPFLGICIFLGLLLTLAPRGGLALHVGAGVGVLILVWLARNAARMGLKVDRDDVQVCGPFSSERVAWSDVSGLDTHRWSINQIVDLKLMDGRTLNTNLIQGASVDWQGGETKDILSVLQAELDAHGSLIEGGNDQLAQRGLPAEYPSEQSIQPG